MIKSLRAAIATVLLLATSNALALGLGQIEVKSRINQPLLAEIPIVSTTPGELQALKARLASPETFRRVGLAPPQGIAADLRFSLGNDARGRPVIRVTTAAPVNQAVLNFLIEVDWGQGRLVREYSALVDAPRTASAPLQPAISAPVVAEPNVVQRPAVTQPTTPAPMAPVAPQIASAPLSSAPVARAPIAEAPIVVAEPEPEPAAEPTPAPTSIAIPPPPRQPEPVSAPIPSDIAVAAPVPPAANAPSQYGPVKAGETLSKIASTVEGVGAYSLNQTMLALLRANPDAFLNDNINLLRQGTVLRVPGSEDRASVSADEAQLVVREQMQQWRQVRRPVMQPNTAVTDSASKPAVTPVKSKDIEAKPAPAKPAKVANAAKAAKAAKPTPAKPVATAKPAEPPSATAKPEKAPQQAQARLEIVPAAVPGKATGTKSGTNVGGEGSMLQQQLQQRDEDLAARKAEISDLKERVAELENLKQQQAQLLTMKDSELAAAQQRLADARKAASAMPVNQPAPAVTAATQATQPVAETQAQASNFMPWLWGSSAVFGLGLLAWLFSRRRPKPIAPAHRRIFDSEALAASMRNPVAAASSATAVEDAAPELDSFMPNPVMPEQAQTVIDHTDVPASVTPSVEAPTWHSGRWVKAGAESDEVAPAASEPRFLPIDDLPPEPLPEPASAEQRMKLARAFLDIGDEHSAKQLLDELLDGADPAMRTEASKLLRELR